MRASDPVRTIRGLLIALGEQKVEMEKMIDDKVDVCSEDADTPWHVCIRTLYCTCITVYMHNFIGCI